VVHAPPNSAWIERLSANFINAMTQLETHVLLGQKACCALVSMTVSNYLQRMHSRSGK